MSYRRAFSGYTIAIGMSIVLLLNGCRTLPPEVSTDTISDDSTEATEKPQDIVPETETPVIREPAIVEEKVPPPETEIPEEYESIENAAVWEPPVERAPTRLSEETRRELVAWMDLRPVVVRLSHTMLGPDSSIEREYVDALVNTGYSKGDVRTTSRRFDECRLVLVLAPETRIHASTKNYYASTVIHVSLSLQGYNGDEVHTIVTGPSVLSSLSHRDAALNSLRRIPPDSLERAILSLRGQLTMTIARRGLPYYFEYSEDTRSDEQYSVLRSLGMPGVGEQMWYIPFPPVPLQNRMSQLLIGSDYDFVLNPATRFGRFIYRDKR